MTWLISTVSPKSGCPKKASTWQESDYLEIVRAARGQIGRTKTHDGSYARIFYPGGDVPIEKGACTDVVVRALRDSLGMDLQKSLHEDMHEAFSLYPMKWGLREPDPNIDHRRVPNLQRYFERMGWSLPVTDDRCDYHPGDLVTCAIETRPHIMIVSDRISFTGIPLVLHNIGRGTREENRLFDFPITGHYRDLSKLCGDSG